jgi:hypothetical protein
MSLDVFTVAEKPASGSSWHRVGRPPGLPL